MGKGLGREGGFCLWIFVVHTSPTFDDTLSWNKDDEAQQRGGYVPIGCSIGRNGMRDDGASSPRCVDKYGKVIKGTGSPRFPGTCDESMGAEDRFGVSCGGTYRHGNEATFPASCFLLACFLAREGQEHFATTLKQVVWKSDWPATHSTHLSFLDGTFRLAWEEKRNYTIINSDFTLC